MGNSARSARRLTLLALFNYQVPVQVLRLSLLAGIWLILLLVALSSMRHAPTWQEADSVQVALKPGESLVLGHDRAHQRDDLGSPYADTEHIRLLRTPTGAWWLENVSATKQVLWTPYDGEERRVRAWALEPGGRFTVGQQAFTVKTVAVNNLSLQSGDQLWRYNGTGLTLNDQPLPACDPLSPHERALKYLRAAWQPLPLSLGGGVRCATRLGLVGAAADSALLVPTPTGYALEPGPAAPAEGALIQVENTDGKRLPLRQLAVPLRVNDRLIIGYTRYRITQASGVSVLEITARGQRWLAEQAQPASVNGVEVTSKPLSWIHAPSWDAMRDAGLTILAVFGVSVLLWGLPRSSWRRSRWQHLGFIGSLALALAWLVLYLLHGGQVPFVWAYASLWIALLSWVWLGRRSNQSALLVGALLWLLGWGLISQGQLGVGAEESGWMRYSQSTAFLGNVIVWLVLAGILFWRNFAPRWVLTQHALIWVHRILTAVVLVLLIVQVAVGDETGVGGFQPIELVKLLLILAVTLTLAERLELSGWDFSFDKRKLWLRYSWLIVLSLAATVIALGLLHDLSPIFLLGVTALALLWAYWRIHPHWGWRWVGQLGLALGVAGLIYALMQLYSHPDWFPHGLQSDRIQVWAAPERYPHSGYQVRKALSEIRAGGWLGLNAGYLPGHVQPGVNGDVMQVPAVQDDFAPAFFLNRYGALLGAVLVIAQGLLVVILFQIGVRALVWTKRQDHWQQLLGHFVYFILWGGGGLLFAHFLVSWGTNLGFLPVMGQPMPFLSAAGSHLVLLLMPLLTLALVAELAQPDTGQKNSGIP